SRCSPPLRCRSGRKRVVSWHASGFTTQEVKSMAVRKVLLALRVPALALSVLSLIVVVPAAANARCKPAAPLPRSRCVTDAQCCSGLVCQGKRCQPGCHIGGRFYASGALNPANACQSCQPAVSTTMFNNRANGTACDDGNACTLNDTCSGGSCQPGTPKNCDDGNVCT